MGFLMFKKAENFEHKNPVKLLSFFMAHVIFLFFEKLDFLQHFFRLVGWVRVRLEFPETEITKETPKRQTGYTLPDM